VNGYRVANRHVKRLGVVGQVGFPFVASRPKPARKARKGIMMADDLLTAVETLLRQAPDSWADAPAEQDALAVLTAAGFVERRITFTVQLPGEERVQRITIEATGEGSLVEAMESVVQDWWARWGQRWRELRQELGDPIKPIVTRESDKWRLSDQGRLARADLEQGDSRPVDFALRRGFFDGKPRRLPDSQITQRQPVWGYGRLVSVENVSGGSLVVSVSNWPEGATAFAKAFAKALDVEPCAHRRRPWPGADKWSNWGVGVDSAGDWHLFHFHRKGTPRWVRHKHAHLNITHGRLAHVARMFVDDGEVVADTRAVRPMKHVVSRLRKAIVEAGHGEGIFPHGNPIPFDYERQAYRPLIRFGRVMHHESGRWRFTPAKSN